MMAQPGSHSETDPKPDAKHSPDPTIQRLTCSKRQVNLCIVAQGQQLHACCRHMPTHVKKLGSIRMRQVSCGWRHSAAITTDGSVYTFGWSKYGQLGHGTYE